MVTVDEASIAKLKTHGQNFEILIDSSKAIAFKSTGNVDIRDVLAAQEIFSDAKKGLVASENSMKNIFKTSDALEVASIIIKKGDIPLTAEYKDQLREEKKKQVINIIHRNAVDPKTHLPHPAQRIENAMVEAKIHIDEFTDINKQVTDVIQRLRPILPLKFEMKEIAVKIPPEFAAKSYATVKSFGKILREDWQQDGSWVATVEMPGGLEEDFYSKLNSLCHGTVESKVLKTK